MSARDELNVSLLTLSEAGARVPCGEPSTGEDWTSDDAARREVAAVACEGCAVIELCAAVAVDEHHAFGIWAGRDRGTKEGRTA